MKKLIKYIKECHEFYWRVGGSSHKPIYYRRFMWFSLCDFFKYKLYKP